MIRKAWLVARLAGQDLKGNAAVHGVALVIITAAFVTVGVFSLAAANLKALARHWEEKVELCVYLAPELPDAEHAALSEKLLREPGVRQVSYVSRDQALADFKKMLGKDAGLLAGLDENPLPASFTVTLAPEARGVDAVQSLSARIGGWSGVEEVDYGGEWLEQFQSALRLAQLGVLVLGALITAAVVFIIGNTIRLTMYSRKEEIGIMRLVGASSWLIRLPFVLEGMAQGASASLLAMIALYGLYRVSLAGAAWPGVLAGFDPVFLATSSWLTLIGGGAVLGAGASMARFARPLRS